MPEPGDQPDAEPTTLRFEGVVDTAAEPDSAGSFEPAVRIGGRAVIAEIERTFGFRPRTVTVALATETFSGELQADTGMRGYSEWTPAEPHQLTVGAHDLLDRLDELDGKEARLWISDGPIDLTDEPS